MKQGANDNTGSEEVSDVFCCCLRVRTQRLIILCFYSFLIISRFKERTERPWIALGYREKNEEPMIHKVFLYKEKIRWND